MMCFHSKAVIPLLFFGFGLGASSAGAVPLFSVDNGTDELVRIDSTTGAVTVVGGLGVNAFDIDLTRTADGRLWGLNSQFQTRVDLLEINQMTGAVISSVQVSLPSGGNLASAEGLGHSGNQLTIGFSPAGNANANSFGNLSSSGAISASVTINFDIDGLSAGAGSVPYYAVDRTPAVSNIVAALDPSGPTVTPVASFGDTFSPNDLVRNGDDILLIDNGSPNLRRIDLNNPTVLNTIALNRSGTYLGLAFAGPVPTPEPATLALFGLGLAGLGLAARRRSTH